MAALCQREWSWVTNLQPTVDPKAALHLKEMLKGHWSAPKGGSKAALHSKGMQKGCITLEVNAIGQLHNSSLTLPAKWLLRELCLNFSWLSWGWLMKNAHVPRLLMLPLLLFIKCWDGLFVNYLTSQLSVTKWFSPGEWPGWLIAWSGHCSWDVAPLRWEADRYVTQTVQSSLLKVLEVLSVTTKNANFILMLGL